MTQASAAFWVPGPLPGLNELIDAAKGAGGRGANYARIKRCWTLVVKTQARLARLPTFPGPVVLAFRWFEHDKRRDPDNVAAGGRKLVLDGLVAAGVLRGDGWRYVTSWTDSFAVASAVPLAKGPGVEVTIHDYGATVGM